LRGFVVFADVAEGLRSVSLVQLSSVFQWTALTGFLVAEGLRSLSLVQLSSVFQWTALTGFLVDIAVAE
jgi:hypothetical protein